MKIVINARQLLQHQQNGIGSFLYETLQRITRQKPEHEFVFLFDRNVSSKYKFSDNVKIKRLFPKADNWITHFFFQRSVRRYAQKQQADLFISSEILLGEIDTPTLAIIPSVHLNIYSHTLKYIARKYNKVFGRFIENSTRIVTTSDFTKNKIIDLYEVNENAVDMLSNGHISVYKTYNETEIEKIRKQYTHGLPYFLFLDNNIKSESLLYALKAYEYYKKSSDTDVKMVIPFDFQRQRWDLKEYYKKMEYKKEVVFIKIQKSEELAKLQAASLAAIFIPLHETLTISIINCFASETPIIASNIGSLPNVVDDAGLLVNPLADESIVSAMKEIDESPQVRLQLIENGKWQAKKYTWENTAKELWVSIEKTINNSRRNKI